MENWCKLYFCNLNSTFFFIINILSFIFFCILLKDPDVLNDGCSLDLIKNWDLDPITDIYLSDEKTDESLKLADLAEYSDKDIKVYPAEIYKWKGQYINVKRDKSSKPINFIEISENSYIFQRFDYKTIRIYGNKYLHYSNKKEDGNILYDLKISFRDKPHTNQKKYSNVCFSKHCVENLGLCLNEDKFELLDNDTSSNFISYNHIELDIKNNIGYYEPKQFHLFKRYKIHEENEKNYIKIMRKLFIAFLILNPILRIIRLLSSCVLKVGTGCCNSLNAVYIFTELINFGLFFGIFILYVSTNDDEKSFYKSYFKGLKFPNKLIFPMFIIECYSFFSTFYLNFQSFIIEPNCTCCGNYDDDLEDILEKEKENKISQKKRISENIEFYEDKMKKYRKENEESVKLLEKAIYDERILNVDNERINFNLHITRTLQIKLEEYYKINDRMEELKNKLDERKNELEKVKQEYNKKMFPEINSLLNGQKIKLNCIYFDENINADEDFCSSYEFFKLLKNSIDGVFFGIKNEEDFYYLNMQLPEDLTIVLIYAINDKEKANEFLNRYHSKCSEIIIFTFDQKDFGDIKNTYKNIISIESDYNSLLSKLIQLKNSDNEDVDKYKPYDLNLYSDYLNDKNMQECHKELLNNTILCNNRRERNFSKGLTHEQYINFLSFLDNDLDDETTTTQDKQKENQQFNVNLNLQNDDNVNPEEDDISIDINLINNYEPRRNNINNIRINNNEDQRRNEENKIRIKDMDETRMNNNEERRKNNEIEIERKDIDRQKEDENNEIRIYDNSNRRRKDSYFDIKLNEGVPNIDISRNKRFKIDNNNSQESEIRELNKKDAVIKIRPKHKEYLGTINKNDKAKIKKILLDKYKTTEGLLKLYTFESGQFYKKLNNWLRTFNLNIYKKIGPISGKIMNFLYLIIKSNKNFIPRKLYRGLTIKKADIFLYKACEGDIFFYPSFTSTTTEAKITDIFKNLHGIDIKKLDEKCNCLIEINYSIRKGDVLQEGDITDYSEKDEKERLFPPYSFFKIKRVLFNDGYENGKKLNYEEIFDGTFERPFKIELEIIRRNFYLDEAITKNKNFNYNKKINRWELEI